MHIVKAANFYFAEAEIEELKRLMGDTMRRLQRRPGASEDRSGRTLANDNDDDETREDRSVGTSSSTGKIDLHLNLHNLMVINEYCSNLMDRLDDERK